ncbi:hypothetical protein ACLOJK_016823 [Asimina triloba]
MNPNTSKLRYLGGEVEHMRVDRDRFSYMDLLDGEERITGMDSAKLIFQCRKLDKDKRDDWTLLQALQSNDNDLNIYIYCIKPYTWELKLAEKSKLDGDDGQRQQGAAEFPRSDNSGYTGKFGNNSNSSGDESDDGIHVARDDAGMTDLNKDTTNGINRKLNAIENRHCINANLTVGQIMDNLLHQYGLSDVGYYKVRRAKDIRLDRIRGSFEESFRRLPSFMSMVLKTNPGSVTRYTMTNEKVRLEVEKRVKIARHSTFLRSSDSEWEITYMMERHVVHFKKEKYDYRRHIIMSAPGFT